MNIIKIIPNNEVWESFKNIFPAVNFVPDWYKKSKPKISNNPTELLLANRTVVATTIKACSPFLDSLINGYMVSLTSDIEVYVDVDGMPNILWRSGQRNIVSLHTNEQYQNLPVPEDCHKTLFKFENEFTFQTPKGYSILFTHPLNRFDLPFYTFSGIVDTDNYLIPVHFPFFLKKNFSGIIESGTPIAQIHLIKREKWKSKFFPYDKKFVTENQEKFVSKIIRSYKSQFWDRKDYD